MCGILLIVNKLPIQNITFLEKLSTLQHRGQDSFGYSYINKNKLNVKYSKDLLKNYKVDETIQSTFFMGHTRYTTSGAKETNLGQPIKDTFKFGEFLFVFNGNIPNYKSEINLEGTDTEFIRNFLIKNSYNFESIDELLIFFIRSIPRAYSLILYCNNIIYALKDRYGVRPLSYILSNTNLTISSEFSEDSKEIAGGEIIKFNNFECKQIYKSPTSEIEASCLFEYIYFMNEKTIWNNLKIENVRGNFGKLLAQKDIDEFFEKDYIVIGIPKSGIPSGKAYAKLLNLTYKQFIKKNPKIERTFILKNNNERQKMSKKKYVFDKELSGKKIIIVDDSIVRGITLKTLINNLNLENVAEIHVRIACPKIKYTCQYGIDIPNKNDLIVNKYDDQELEKNFKCNSLKFVNLDDIKKNNVIPHFNKLCTGCFNNDYKNLEW